MIGKFWTTRGFFYRGEILAETETHWKIHDISTDNVVELLKSAVERIVWEAV